MAYKMDDMKKNLEDFEREVTCAVCLEHYTEPKVLSCLHYYCKTCIVKLALKKNPFPCPDCRKKVKLEVGKEDELPTAHFINRLKELHAKQEKVLSRDVVCEVCTKIQVQAEAYCKQCGKFICKRCVESHSVMSAFFEGHEIVSMAEFKDLNEEDIVSKSTPGKKCRVHKKNLKFYCYGCKCLICRDCIVIDHKDHKIEFNNVAANENRELLSESVKPLAKIGNDLSRAMIEITKTSAEIEAQGHDVAKRIESSFEELHAILERRKNLLLEEVRDKVKQKTKNLKEQNESLSVESANVRSVIDYTQQCVQYCSDSDIMKMHDDIAAKIKQEIDDHNTPERKMFPLEEVDIDVEVKCVDPLQELCRSNVHLTQIPVVIKFKKEDISGIVNETSEVHVSLALANGGQLKGDPDVSSELRKQSVMVRKNIVTKKAKHGEYNIAFTPRSSGEHNLSVTVNNNGVQFSRTVTVLCRDRPSFPRPNRTEYYYAVNYLPPPANYPPLHSPPSDEDT